MPTPLPLTKLSETATKITLNWAPVPGAVGYRFQSATQAPKWSHTWDPNRSQVTFAKADWYKVEALGVEAAGDYPVTQQPPLLLPASRVTLDPGEKAAWMTCDSPTTQIVGATPTTGSRDKHRIIRWDAEGLYSARKTYALFGFKLIRGFPGRIFDFHTSPVAVGGWTPPGDPDGVAPLAIDYRDNGGGIQIVNEPDFPNHETTIIPQSEVKYGVPIWLWAEIVWGRPGSLKVWVAGEDTPRVSRSAKTHYDTQNLVTFWEGAYESSGASVKAEIEVYATRFGRTPQECYADQPHVYTRDSAGEPPGSLVAIPDVDGGSAPIPAALA